MKYKSQAEYDKKNTRSFTIKLNYNTDANIISKLESCENVQGYIKRLIEKDVYHNTEWRKV